MLIYTTDYAVFVLLAVGGREASYLLSGGHALAQSRPTWGGPALLGAAFLCLSHPGHQGGVELQLWKDSCPLFRGIQLSQYFHFSALNLGSVS